MKLTSFTIYTLIFLLLSSGPLLAETPPLPERKTKSLSELRETIQKEKQETKALESRVKDVQSALEKTQNRLVALGEKIQNNEKKIKTLRDDIARKETEQAAMTQALEKDFGAISEIILALQRIKRTPPEALIVRPGAPLETAQSASLLKSALPAVNARAKEISERLQKLEAVKSSLLENRKKLYAQRKNLAAERESMAQLEQQRKSLYARLKSDYAYQKRKLARMAEEARNLEDLVRKLEAARREEERQVRQTSRGKPSRPTPVPGPGQARLPVTGQIVTAYNDMDDIGARSQGIRILSQPDALVIAPMGGVVRFAGVFKNYGNMVIIEHENGYHSLIGGMQSVTAMVQNPVKAGEPIGKLPNGASPDGDPTLYYELRRDGRPVNPAKKIADLKS